jgi:hypothetical protein
MSYKSTILSLCHHHACLFTLSANPHVGACKKEMLEHAAVVLISMTASCGSGIDFDDCKQCAS